MPLINAIGSSLVSVTAFGLTTAASYAWSGLVDWPLAGLFIVGGALGGFVGIRLAHHLAGHKHALTRIFSGVVIAVGIYVIVKLAARGLELRPCPLDDRAQIDPARQRAEDGAALARQPRGAERIGHRRRRNA